ncbi:MAG: carbohydrate-binding domain-containing protein [Desulfobacterales bacterium]
MNFRISDKIRMFFILFSIFCFPQILAAGTCTTYDYSTATAHIPSLKIGEGYYWVDLKVTGDVLRLTDFGDAKNRTACAEYNESNLSVHIPCLDLGDSVTYWVDLVLQASENIDLAITAFGENTGDLVINEIMAKDVNDGSDWIELYVKGTQAVNLADYSLTDEEADHEKISLPAVTLQPGQFYLIQATDTAPADGSAYVAFKLGADDSVILYKGENIVDAFDWEDIDAPEGCSFGRLPDGTGIPQTLSPTPGTANAAGTTLNTRIILNGNSISINGSGASAEGSTATITSAGIYHISGSLTDGQLTVNTEDAESVNLMFNGVSIHSSKGPAVYIMNAEETRIILADNSENYISDGAAYISDGTETDQPNAAVFSKDDLTISGSGSLTVEANYNDGIASKDDLVLSDASITVTSADDGIRGKNSLVIEDGNITVNAGGDGLKSDNDEDSAEGYISIENGEIRITSGGDAIAAQTSVTISDGEFVLTSGGGSSKTVSGDTSAKGIKAGTSVTIDEGIFAISSADDAIHSNGILAINSGVFNLSSGDDGIHADSSVEINNGDIVIAKSYEGIESAVITVNDGDISIVSSDDGINVAGGNDGSGMMHPGQTGRPGGMPGQDTFVSSGNYWLYINGGRIVINASGDGLDANGSIEMTGGTVIVNGPTDNGNGALDYLGTFRITGGFLLAAGSSGMAQAPSTSSSQYSVLLNLNSARTAGTLFHIQTSTGNEILTFAPSKRYQSIVFSFPELTRGSTYDVYLGGTSSGTVTDGLHENGIYTPGSKYTSFTVSGAVTTIGANRF